MLVFKCKWVNGNTGVHQDHFGFTLVDLNKVAYMNKPFIMAERARQVFYVQDPCDSRLSVVLQGRPSGIGHQNDDSTLVICETSTFSKRLPSINEELDMDDVHDVGEHSYVTMPFQSNVYHFSLFVTLFF